jgi:hypothetical protein
MIVNETKTNIMVFGKEHTTSFKFDGKDIALTDKYKYLGVVNPVNGCQMIC